MIVSSKANSNLAVFLISSFFVHLLLLMFFAHKVTQSNNNIIGLDLSQINFTFKNNKILSSKKSAAISKDILVDSNNEKTSDKKITQIHNSKIKGYKPSPNYPKRALMLKQEGTVILNALIDKRGDILKIDLIKSSGFNLLDDAAILAVEKWKFDPIRDLEGSSSLFVRIPIEFLIG